MSINNAYAFAESIVRTVAEIRVAGIQQDDARLRAAIPGLYDAYINATNDEIRQFMDEIEPLLLDRAGARMNSPILRAFEYLHRAIDFAFPSGIQTADVNAHRRALSENFGKQLARLGSRARGILVDGSLTPLSDSTLPWLILQPAVEALMSSPTGLANIVLIDLDREIESQATERDWLKVRVAGGNGVTSTDDVTTSDSRQQARPRAGSIPDRATAPSVSLPLLSVTLDPPQAKLDSEIHPIGNDEAAFLRALIDADFDWVSGTVLGVRISRLKIPDSIRLLIRKQAPHGSKLIKTMVRVV